MKRGDIRHVFVGPTGRRVGQKIEYFVDEEELKEMFGKFGKVEDVKVRSNAKHCFAFIHFEHSDSCDKAIRELDRSTIKGNEIKVSWGSYNPHQRRSTYTPGGGRGRGRGGGHYRYQNNRSSGSYGAVVGNGYASDNEPRTVRYAPRMRHSQRNEYSTRRTDYSSRGREYPPRRTRHYSPTQARQRSYTPDRASRRSSNYHPSTRHTRRSRSRSQYSPVPRGEGNQYRTTTTLRETHHSPRRDRDRGRKYEARSRSHSPTPKRSLKTRRHRSPRSASPAKIYRLTIEDLPPEMEWDDLQDIGKKYGGSNTVVAGKCWNEDGTNMGVVEFNSSSARLGTHDALKGHRINGHKIKLFLD